MSGILGEGLLGDFSLGDEGSSSTFTYGQAQAGILKTTNTFAQAQARILGLRFAQSQSNIKQIYQGFAQGQGLIGPEKFAYGQAQGYLPTSATTYNTFAQALAFICWTDTFTRTTSYGLGSDYTWVDFDTAFNAQEDSGFHVDGSKLVTSNTGSQGYDSYQLNRTVPENGIVQFEFTTPSSFGGGFSDIIVVFGNNGFEDKHSIGVYGYPDSWELAADWSTSFSASNVPVVLQTSTTYRVKATYADDGRLNAKVWDISGAEPDYMLIGVTAGGLTGSFASSNRIWLDTYFRGNFASFDNLTFCIGPGPVGTNNTWGQAVANITNTTPNGQAQADISQVYRGYGQAQAVLNQAWGLAQAQAQLLAFDVPKFGQVQALIQAQFPFIDTFTRSVSPGMGDPYLWPGYSWIVGPPPVKTVSVNGNELVIPAHGTSPYYDSSAVFDSYYLPIKILPQQGFIQFDFNTGSAPRADYNPIFSVTGRAPTSSSFAEIDIGVRWREFNNSWYVGSFLTGNGTAAPALSDNTWYTINFTWNGNQSNADWRLWNRATGVVVSTGSYGTSWSVYTNDGSSPVYTLVNLTMIGNQTSNDFLVDNLIIGQRFPTGQARAKIKVVNTQYAQVQATIRVIRQVNGQSLAAISNPYHLAQAQAFILLPYGVGNAQALINARFGLAQAQAQLFLKINLEYPGSYEAHGGGGGAQRLTPFFHVTAGQTITVRVTTPPSDGGNIGIWGDPSYNSYYFSPTSNTDYTFTSFSTGFYSVYSWNGGGNRPSLSGSGFVLVYDYIGAWPTGQAKADIKQTTNKFGQAQALLNTGFGISNAQAKINAFGTNKFGQVQASILPYKGFLATVRNNISGFNYDTGSFYGTYWEVSPSQPNYAENGTITPVYPGNDSWGIRWDTQFWTADVSGTWSFATSSDDGSYLYIYDESGSFIGGINNNYNGGQGETYASANVTLVAGTKYRIEMKFGQGGGAWRIRGYYRRPGAGADSYLTDGAPPWMIVITQQVAQAQALILPRQAYAQAQATTSNIIVGIGQAQADILATNSRFGQAQAQIIAFNVNKFAQALAMMIPSRGLLYYHLIGGTPRYLSPDIGTITYVGAETLSGRPNYPGISNPPGYSQNDDWGIRYQKWFVADVTGTWTFTIKSDDGSRLELYDTDNSLFYQLDQAYGNPTGNNQASSTVNLTAGTKYKLDYKYAQGGGGYNIEAWYRRPADTSDIRLTDGSPPWMGAIILSYGQAQAIIISSPQKSAQAQAKLNSFDYPRHAQAQADILVTYNKFGQARAVIIQVVFGQAQAYIIALRRDYAQAQARILATVNAHGQAAGTTLFIGIAQANADIKQKYQVYGQAFTRIKVTSRVYGQSLAFIKFRIRPVAQSQAFIRQLQYRGFGQAQATIPAKRFGQAQAFLIRPVVRQQYGQAQAFLNRYFAWSQAQAKMNSVDFNKHGQAQARLIRFGQPQFAQALAMRADRWRLSGQALAHINKPYWSLGNARACIVKAGNYGQAAALIVPTVRYSGYAQAQAYIVGNILRYAQARAKIARSIAYGNAKALIYTNMPSVGPLPPPGTLVKYNNYTLPGYLQSESLEDQMRMFMVSAPYEIRYTENIGLENKQLSLRLLVLDYTYAQAKAQILQAGTVLRSNRSGFGKLTVNSSKYYLAQPRNITATQAAGRRENAAEYNVEFHVKPWLYGTNHIITGTTLLDTNDVARDMTNGTWSYANLRLSGTNVTVSGYTETGDFTGFASVAGTVNNFEINSENYTSTQDSSMNNYDYQIRVGTGRTLFAVTGATECTIEWQDRWGL